jgi:hypothetical protein
MIPNYVCTTCGRGFASARSARRHVAKVEANIGYVVTEAEYRTSLITGKIPPPAPKSIRSKKDMTDVAFEEFVRGFYRRLGEKKAETADPILVQDMMKLFWIKMTSQLRGS